LIIEELLLEALCFDFVVESPHAELLDMFESLETTMESQEFAWSIANDSSVILKFITIAMLTQT